MIPHQPQAWSGRQETDVNRQRRPVREEVIIAGGRADIAAGRGIDGTVLNAWLDLLDENPDAPVPTF